MSNQDYTQDNQYGQDMSGTDQEQYGSMRDPGQRDPRTMNPNQIDPSQLDPNQLGQDAYSQGQGSGMGGASSADERDYGMRDRYAQSGTLNQGYGEAGQMGEDQWAQQSGQGQQDQYDPQRGNIGASASDRFEREMRERAGGGGDTGEEFRDMVGGMYGEDDDSQRER